MLDATTKRRIDDCCDILLGRIPNHKFRHGNMVSLVQTMLDLNKALQTVKTPDEKTALQRQITATDNQIDQLVYELYNLTPEEIQIVEDATK